MTREFILAIGQSAGFGAALVVASCLAAPALATELQNLPNAWEAMPPGYVQTGDASGQGRLWSDPTDGSLATTYCVYRSKIVCVIYHIERSSMAPGNTWPDTIPVQGGAPVDHVGLASDAKGLVVSLYLLDDAQLRTIQPPYDYHY